MKIGVVLLLLLAGCSAGNVRPLTYTSVDDPIWDINPEKWKPVGNTLTQPPTASAGRIPSASN